MKRRYSLKRNKQFRYVYRKGRSAAARSMVMIHHRNGGAGLHVGFSVSKKLGNSVIRNRIKRRLREAFRPLIPDLKAGYDIIFIAREPILTADFSAIGSSMTRLLKQAGLMKQAQAVAVASATASAAAAEQKADPRAKGRVQA